MKKKAIAIALGAVGIAIGLGTLAVQRWMEKPLYQPGSVRAGTNLRFPLEPPKQTLSESGFWLVEPDIKLRTFSAGTGRRVLVIHGGPGIPFRDMPPGFHLMTNNLEFHFYDQRGCGQSTRPFERFESKNYYENMVELERTLGIGAQVADIERIRRILGQEKLTIIGHSFGGFLAAMYAAEFPERVAELVLVAPSGVLVLPQRGGDFFQDIRTKLPENQKPLFDTFIEDYLDFRNLFTRTENDLAVLHARLSEFFLAASGQQGSKVEEKEIGGWMVFAQYLSMGKRHDYREALKAVKAPVLILHGENDILPQSASRLYAEALPNARLEILRSGTTGGAGSAGHFAFSDNPEQFASAVLGFVEGVTQR